MNFYRKGFTLVEILVVIAIIGIFAASTMYFTQDSRIDQTKAERLANSIHDTMKNARNNMLIGRGVYSGSTLYPTDRRTIRITGGGISTDYAINGTSTGTETNVGYPFFDNDPQYKITDISVSSGILSNGQKINWDHTGVTLADITIEPNGSMTILALKGGMPISETINTVRVTAGYGDFTQSVMLDRLVGRSEVVQAQGDQIFSNDPACAAPPSCVGLGSCTATPGTPSMVDQAWVYSALNCGFTCNTNYNWNGTSCVAATQTANCTSTPPLNATASTPTTFTQTWNGSIFAPASLSWTHGAATCGFNCNTNYTWNGSTTCDPATDIYACNVTSLPSNAVPSSTMYTRTWNGTIFAPATMNYTHAATNCGFTCATNYNWNSATSTCDAATNTFNCAAKPAVGTVWNTVPSYIQTWNGSAWTPANSVTAYNTTPSTTDCRYRCALNYTWNGSLCVAATQSVNCGGTIVPNATASTPTTYNQTWDGSTWIPTTTWSYLGGSCGFACNGGYTWNGSACVPFINGACNPTFNSLIAPTPTCAAGNPTAISGTGPWTWGCNSPNGGTSTAVNACSANKRVDCVEGWGACVLGSRNNIITTPPANGGTACVNPATQACGTAGVCNNSVQFACTTGTSVSNNPGSCGGNATWNCDSTNGGTSASCSKANAACINGTCNPTFDSYTTPTATCIAGNPTGFSGTGPWTWGCNSPNGGTNTASNACSANKRVNCIGGWGACVAGSQTYTVTTPAANGGVVCTSTNGATQLCGTPAVCGTAHAQSHPTIPVTGLCSSGNPTVVTGTGPWNWSCNSTDGGTNASCNATLTSNSCNPSLPVCTGSSCNLTYSPSYINQPWNKDASSCGFACSGTWYGASCLDRNCTTGVYQGTACSATCGGGNYEMLNAITVPASGGGSCGVTAGSRASWGGASCNMAPCPIPASLSGPTACSGGNQIVTCIEQTGGHPTTCAVLGYSPGPNNQTCGTNGVCSTSEFSCLSGTAAAQVYNQCGSPSTWNCLGSGGGINAMGCSLSKPACINGACNATFNAYPTPSATCAAGTPVGFSGTGPWTWACYSPNGGTNTASNACSANKKIDCIGAWGSCNPNFRGYTISTPASNGGVACSYGNGTIQSCGKCGTANGASYPSAPSTGLCSSGNPTPVTGSGPWNWNCNSTNGGPSMSCSANKTCYNVTYNTVGCGGWANGSPTRVGCDDWIPDCIGESSTAAAVKTTCPSPNFQGYNRCVQGSTYGYYYIRDFVCSPTACN